MPMRTWTNEERYKYLEDPSELLGLYEDTKDSVYRQTYHIQAVTGLINDPNGFSYFGGKWHMFYQWCPWGAVHGLKYWYHVVSEDLVNWKNVGVGLKPEEEYVYDNKGVYSGSGYSLEDKLFLYYTGNNRDDDYIRHPYTCLAKMDKEGRIEKATHPLFKEHPDYTEHQRDPKLVAFPEKNRYYIVIGARTKDERGCILIYGSQKPASDYEFLGELKVPGYESFGGMWECPSIEHIGDKDVLIFCPQYLKLPGRGNGTNQNVNIVGRMDWDDLIFTPEKDFSVLDEGFDFYAAACAFNTKDERTIMSAWMGLPDVSYPTDEEDWSGCLTLPRELSIKEGRLYQRPVREIVSIRDEELDITDNEDGIYELPKTYELLIDVKSKDFKISLFTDERGEGGLSLRYDSEAKLLTFDRGNMKTTFNENEGFTRGSKLIDDLYKLQIYTDKSSVEIFVNDGEATFTSRVFPDESERYLAFHAGEVDMKAWSLKTSVDQTFVI